MRSSLFHSLLAGLLPFTTSFVIPSPDSLPEPQSLLFPSSPDQDAVFSHHPSQDHLQPAPPTTSSSSYRIPTRYESTVLARRLLTLSNIGVLSTVFPPPSSSSLLSTETPLNNADTTASSNRPESVANTPFGMIDYIADCESHGDPTILGLFVATTFQNAAPEAPHDQIRNISLSLDWWEEYRRLKKTPHHHNHNSKTPNEEDPRDFDLGLYSPASLPRLTLMGHLEPISHSDLENNAIEKCFLDKHPDAKWWLPGSKGAAHMGRWLRLVVEEVYMIGGFGDRAFIGWLDPVEWRGVTAREIGRARLVGEDE